MVTLFDKALAELKGKPYQWPEVSCVNFIEILSTGAQNMPDYSEWKVISEPKCMAKIGKNNFTQYINEHRKCLGPSWYQPMDEIIQGDMVFYSKCKGQFVNKETDEVIFWESADGFPATLFAESPVKFWSFAGKYGLKRAFPEGEPLAVFRRKPCEL